MLRALLRSFASPFALDGPADGLHFSVRLLWLLAAVVAVWTHVVARGCREGWWPVLDGFLRDCLRGLVVAY